MRAAYAGSFDPPTIGHVWMIDEAQRLFGDGLTVVLAANKEKSRRLSVDTRRHLLGSMFDGEIATIENEFLATWASRHKFDVLIRGIRGVGDFEYEAAMSSVNAEIPPFLSTVFLIPPRELREVSSSFVMSMVGVDGWESVVRNYVTPPVLAALKDLK